MYPNYDQNPDLFDIEVKLTFLTTEEGGRSTPTARLRRSRQGRLSRRT